MNDMDTQNVIVQIDTLLKSNAVPRNEKRMLLRRLAQQYWKLVFPEYGTPQFDQLSIDEQETRWALQRERKDLSVCSDPHAVQRVLDSPGTGDPFTWVT